MHTGTWAPVWSICVNGPTKQGVLWNYWLKLQVKMASCRRACRKQRILLQCWRWRWLCFCRWCNTSFLSKWAYWSRLCPFKDGEAFAGTTVRVYKVLKVSWTLGCSNDRLDSTAWPWRETYLPIIFQGVPRSASSSYEDGRRLRGIWNNHDEQLINFCNIYLKKFVKE